MRTEGDTLAKQCQLVIQLARSLLYAVLFPALLRALKWLNAGGQYGKMRPRQLANYGVRCVVLNNKLPKSWRVK